MTTLIRKSLELTQTQWEQLGQLAQQLNTIPRNGPTPNKPSWRTLIKEVANGTITLTKEERE